MKSRTLTCITAITLLAALALPVQLAAQHTRYKLIDLDTFGGPSSIIAPSDGGGPENPARAFTARGVLVGAAETAIPDLFAPNNCVNPECLAVHAFRWQGGNLIDLGTLGGVDIGLNSVATWINDRGWIAGQSEIAISKPVLAVPFQDHAVLWTNGGIVDLGTLGGGFAGANAINNHGQVVGFSLNTIPDPLFPLLGFPTEGRAFLWQNGVMHDLGTLGGPDSVADAVNERGQVAGFSTTDTALNATTGLPTIHPFLWERGRMTDLGTLGGTLTAVDGPNILMNNRGQIAGTSTLAGDINPATGNLIYHPFVWEHGVMTNVGTLGGDTGFISWINDAGEAIGTADLPGPSGSQSHHAFLWRNGVKTDLGTLGATSHAEGINSAGQIVGRSKPTPDSPVQHAFLWEHGGPMVDLNTLIPANSGLLLEEGGNINDRGEIAGRGVPPGCDDVDACGHAFLLIPCDSDASCENKTNVMTAMNANTAAFVNKASSRSSRPSRTPMSMLSAWRERLAQRYPSLAHKDW